jgi:hypothetical protein
MLEFNLIAIEGVELQAIIELFDIKDDLLSVHLEVSHLEVHIALHDFLLMSRDEMQAGVV